MPCQSLPMYRKAVKTPKWQENSTILWFGESPPLLKKTANSTQKEAHEQWTAFFSLISMGARRHCTENKFAISHTQSIPKMAATTPRRPVAPVITRGFAAPEEVSEPPLVPVPPLVEPPLVFCPTLDLQVGLTLRTLLVPLMLLKCLHESSMLPEEIAEKVPLTSLRAGNSILIEKFVSEAKMIINHDIRTQSWFHWW